jgi:hypothetical protein
MMNKKLIALFVAIASVSAISADYGDCWIDRNGYKHCKDVVEPVRATGEVAVEAVEGTADVATGVTSDVLGGVFGGERRGVRERVRDRRERRQERRGNYRD